MQKTLLSAKQTARIYALATEYNGGPFEGCQIVHTKGLTLEEFRSFRDQAAMERDTRQNMIDALARVLSNKPGIIETEERPPFSALLYTMRVFAFTENELEALLTAAYDTGKNDARPDNITPIR